MRVGPRITIVAAIGATAKMSAGSCPFQTTIWASLYDGFEVVNFCEKPYCLLNHLYSCSRKIFLCRKTTLRDYYCCCCCASWTTRASELTGSGACPPLNY